MFKKLILICIVFSPFWFSMIAGYPVISDQDYRLKTLERQHFAISKRCFAVGDFKEFISCWKVSERIRGEELVSDILVKTNTISYLFSAVIVISFILFILLAVSIL